MKVAFYERANDNIPANITATWEELVELLSEMTFTDCSPCEHPKHCVAKVGGRAWSPVDIPDGKTRASVNVQAITALVLDLDHLDDDGLLAVAERIEGYEYLIHSTHSHRPPNDHCYRLIIPISRPVLAREWPVVLKSAVRFLDLPADPTCKDLARLYFLPTIAECHRDAALVQRGTGRHLDVDALLATAKAPEIKPAREWAPTAEEESTVDLKDLRARVRSVRARKAKSEDPSDVERYQILGRVLDEEPLAEPGARDNTVNQAAALLAFILPVTAGKEAMIEVLRPSLTAMQTDPEGLDHWISRAEYSFARARERRAERDAVKEAGDATLRKSMREMAERKGGALGKIGPRITDSDIARAEAEATGGVDEGDGWMTELITQADGKPVSCGENVVVILTKSPECRGTMRYNEVTKTIEINGGPFEGVSLEVLDVTVADWMKRNYGITISASDAGKRIARVARMSAYDPLADYLNRLRWDGKPRAGRLFFDYMQARTTDGLGNPITEHLERIGERWLISAVARALRPGCQVDTVLVLEGLQGKGKTSAFRVLGGEWFCETELTLGDKDSKMLASTSWIVELAEMVSLKKAEREAQKAFLTTRKDKFRPPYGATMVDVPRRCVFVGTTNESHYLIDYTGNRRYWPVYCEMVHLDRLERDRDQLWAEAVEMFKAGKAWWLSGWEQDHANVLTDERVEESAIEGKIAEWWASTHPKNRPEIVTTTMVLETVLRYSSDRMTRAAQMEVGQVLSRLGFTKVRKRVDGRLTYAYEPTRVMKEAPQKGHAPHLRLVATAKVTDEQGPEKEPRTAS